MESINAAAYLYSINQFMNVLWTSTEPFFAFEQKWNRIGDGETTDSQLLKIRQWQQPRAWNELRPFCAILSSYFCSRHLAGTVESLNL